jgi:hypothetical protein
MLIVYYVHTWRSSGVQVYHPAIDLLGRVRGWFLWWLLPPVFAAAVPALRVTDI